MFLAHLVRGLCPFVLGVSLVAQAPVAPLAEKLIGLAKAQDASLGVALGSAFGAERLRAGTAAMAFGADVIFAVSATVRPELLIDGRPGPAMRQAGGGGPWYAVARVEPVGAAHGYTYAMEGKVFGGSNDLAVFGPESYGQAGVPQGTLSAKRVHTSKIYDGMKSEYWVYVPAQYDAKVPAAVMVFQDGGGYIGREGGWRATNVIDNLIAQKKIPVMVAVFINPGSIEESPGTPTFAEVKAYSDKWKRTMKDSMRSVLYDTVSDRYDQFLQDEVLAEVGAQYNLRRDAYSRAITGSSSGGICAFNAAWQRPREFSRLISWIGSFTAIQWKEEAGLSEGGQDYPEKVLREEKRNVRVWLQDGAGDMENDRFGSWPLANIRMANALKLKGYDFHLTFGKGTHNQAEGAAMFPEEMVWLWRDYDPGKTEQVFEMEPEERAKPLFRVGIVGRDAK